MCVMLSGRILTVVCEAEFVAFDLFWLGGMRGVFKKKRKKKKEPVAKDM